MTACIKKFNLTVHFKDLNAMFCLLALHFNLGCVHSATACH